MINLKTLMLASDIYFMLGGSSQANEVNGTLSGVCKLRRDGSKGKIREERSSLFSW
jgi:hypothetical protein